MSVFVMQQAYYWNRVSVCYALSTMVNLPHIFTLSHILCTPGGNTMSSSIPHRKMLVTTCFSAAWRLHLLHLLLRLYFPMHEYLNGALHPALVVWACFLLLPLTIRTSNWGAPWEQPRLFFHEEEKQPHRSFFQNAIAVTGQFKCLKKSNNLYYVQQVKKLRLHQDLKPKHTLTTCFATPLS